MASAHENVQGCVTYHERPASTPCDAPPAAPTARGRARRQVPPANKNTVSFRVCIRSADCSSDLCPFAILSSSSCPCFRRPRIDGGTCLRSTSRYRRTLSAATTGAAAPAGGLAALPVAQGCVVAYRRPARRIRAARPSRAAPQWNVKRLRRNLHRLGWAAARKQFLFRPEVPVVA